MRGNLLYPDLIGLGAALAGCARTEPGLIARAVNDANDLNSIANLMIEHQMAAAGLSAAM